MINLDNRISRSEWVKLINTVNVVINVVSKPENLLLNPIIEGIISSNLIGHTKLVADNGRLSTVILKYPVFKLVFTQLILSGISDRRDILISWEKNCLSIVFPNFNDIARSFFSKSELGMLSNTMSLHIDVKVKRDINMRQSFTSNFLHELGI